MAAAPGADPLELPARWTMACAREEWRYANLLALPQETVERYFQELVRSTFVKGFTRLSAVNGPMAEELLRRARSSSVSIRCKNLQGPYGESRNPLLARLIGPGWINVNSALLSVYASAKELNKTIPADGEMAAFRVAEDGGDLAIFHEMLHAVGLDTLPMRVHNDPRADRSKDLVFACTDAVFSASRDDCIACALARSVNGSFVASESPADVDAASRSCDALSRPGR